MVQIKGGETGAIVRERLISSYSLSSQGFFQRYAQFSKINLPS